MYLNKIMIFDQAFYSMNKCASNRGVFCSETFYKTLQVAR